MIISTKQHKILSNQFLLTIFVQFLIFQILIVSDLLESSISSILKMLIVLVLGIVAGLLYTIIDIIDEMIVCKSLIKKSKSYNSVVSMINGNEDRIIILKSRKDFEIGVERVNFYKNYNQDIFLDSLTKKLINLNFADCVSIYFYRYTNNVVISVLFFYVWQLYQIKYFENLIIGNVLVALVLSFFIVKIFYHILITLHEINDMNIEKRSLKCLFASKTRLL